MCHEVMESIFRPSQAKYSRFFISPVERAVPWLTVMSTYSTRSCLHVLSQLTFLTTYAIKTNFYLQLKKEEREAQRDYVIFQKYRSEKAPRAVRQLSATLSYCVVLCGSSGVAAITWKCTYV